MLVSALGIHAYQLKTADQHIRQLQAQAASVNAQAGKLSDELQRIERQNAEIRRAIGVHPKSPSRRAVTHALDREGPDFSKVASRLAHIAAESEQARAATVELGGLAKRVLNLRRIEAIAHARMLASIPSLIPAGEGGVASRFGYRSSPWPEFHSGVDLEADYGDTVHAAASGVVASAGWDGGFGNKVDIDHGNGLHTWYAHLSRIGVHPGQAVIKGQPIAAVGSTGEATGPHLHYQIMRDGNAIDPQPFLAGQGAKILGLDTSGAVRR